MVVELTVTGNGKFSGTKASLSTYAAVEDATPLTGASNYGGTGQLTFSVRESASTASSSLLLLNDTVELTDESNGRTRAVVNNVSITDTVASVSADSRMSKLLATRTADPKNATLANVIKYYLSLAEIIDDIVIAPGLPSGTFAFPGWTGVVWDMLKQLAIAYNFEISLVSSNVVARPLRLRNVQTRLDSTQTVSVNNGQLAREIEVAQYNNEWKTNAIAYPVGGWTTDTQVYQVAADELLELDIPTDASLVSVNQPACVASVAPNYSGTASVYTVIGKDGLPIPPAQWVAGGGKITVAIGEDRRSVKVSIQGSMSERYAPYRIAMASSATIAYSTLRITGTGTYWKRDLLTRATGTPDAKTATVVGITIDNPFISTGAQAATEAYAAAQYYASPKQTLSVSARVVNRVGEKGAMDYPTFADFDALYAGKTFADFNAINAGKTFADLNKDLLGELVDDFENQAFGNIAGARTKHKDAMYRITTATTTESGITYSAERDTTFADFNDAWAGKTFADFDAAWTGYTFEDFAMMPLRTGDN